MGKQRFLLFGVLALSMAALLLLLSCAETSTQPSNSSRTKSGWIMNDLESGKKLAQKENKLILMEFWADW